MQEQLPRSIYLSTLRAVLRTFKIIPDDFVELGVRTNSSNTPSIKKPAKAGLFMDGAPGEIRTPDRSVRSRVLYPTELQAHILNLKFPSGSDPVFLMPYLLQFLERLFRASCPPPCGPSCGRSNSFQTNLSNSRPLGS